MQLVIVTLKHSNKVPRFNVSLRKPSFDHFNVALCVERKKKTKPDSITLSLRKSNKVDNHRRECRYYVGCEGNGVALSENCLLAFPWWLFIRKGVLVLRDAPPDRALVPEMEHVAAPLSQHKLQKLLKYFCCHVRPL